MNKNLSCGRIGVNVDLAGAIELAHYYGFDSIDPHPSELAQLSDEELATLGEEMRSKRLIWAAGGCPVQFRESDELFAKGMKDMPAYAKTLQRAGVDRASTWLMFGSDDLTYREYGRRTTGRLRAIAEIFGEHGVRFGLEYVGTYSAWTTVQHPWVHTMAETRELIADIGLDNVGLAPDSWHWYHAHETADDIRALSNNDIVVVDLNDAPKKLTKKEMQDNAREVPCSTGVIDTAAFMRALKDIGYDGPIRAEPFSKALSALENADAVEIIAGAFQTAWGYLDPS